MKQVSGHENRPGKMGTLAGNANPIVNVEIA
jgi:hypothetical protein